MNRRDRREGKADSIVFTQGTPDGRARGTEAVHIVSTQKCMCGRQVSFGFEDATQDPRAFHELPPCKAYLEKELVEYTRCVTDHLARSMGVGIG